MFTLSLPLRKRLLQFFAVLLFFYVLPSPSLAQVNFSHSVLSGFNFESPTTLQFGPDGRLYIANQIGQIKVLTISKTGTNSYTPTSIETINLILEIPNHNDDNTPCTYQYARQITGILVVGTAQNPVIYVSSSDPRVGGGGEAGDVNLDTNSGIISRLTWNGSSWEKVDIIRGLPRSEENHANNGLQIDPSTNTMYCAVGGNTNAGAPSNNFAYLNEYALAAAIIKIDLNVINSLPVRGTGNDKYIYDIPTLNDPTREDVPNPDYNPALPGSPQFMDVNDPWGGNDGRNMAKLIPGGPVQIHSGGWRNPYDIVLTTTPGKEGRLYSVDNGANVGWGGYPKNVNTPNITNEYMDGEPGSTAPYNGIPGVNNQDNLHLVSKPGMAPIYAGHPHPLRANPAGAGLYWRDDSTGVGVFSLNPTTDWPPVPVDMADPREANLLIPGVDDGALTTWPTSTNGIAEYKSPTIFGGQMTGDILTVDFSGILWRLKMNEEGTAIAVKEVFASGFGQIPLDVTAQNDGENFAGTIWVCDYMSGQVHVFTPMDDAPVVCTGNNTSYVLDDDGDGYSNADETDNASNPCNTLSIPSDFDGDKISDKNDPDDDNDGIPDISDKFHRDAANGNGTNPTILYPFLNGNPGTGLFGMGFTGLMSNGTTNPDAMYDLDNPGLIMGGAVGLASFPADQGSALTNNQNNAFHFGYKVNSASPVFSVQSSLISPYFNGAAASSLNAMHRQGIYIGTGDQSNYLMFAMSGSNGGNAGFRLLVEDNDVVVHDEFIPVANLLDATNIYLFIDVNPSTGVAEFRYKISQNSPLQTVGAPITMTGNLLAALQGPDALAIGIIAQSGTAEPYAAKWDYMNIITSAPAVSTPIPDQQVDINTPTHTVSLANVFSDDEGAANITLAFESNSNSALITNATLNGTDLVLTIAPNAVGTAVIKVKATDSDGFVAYDEFKVNVTGEVEGPPFSLNINSGGVAITQGNWIADQYYTGGATYSEYSLLVSNTDNPAIYQDELYGNITYSVPVPNGKYTVKLHFAEIYFTTPGARIFNVNIEGNPALTNYDIVAKAGAFNAVIEQINNIQVNDGFLTIQFVNVQDNAKISGIEILQIKGNANSAPTIAVPIADQAVQVNSGSKVISLVNTFADDQPADSLVLSVSGNSNPALVTGASISGKSLTLTFAQDIIDSALIKIKATDSAGLFVEDEFKVVVQAGSQVPTTVRINSGGEGYTLDGITWLADQYYTGGSVYGDVIPIAGTTNDSLHHDERYGEFTYAVPVSNGTYTVKLHFAEIYFTTPGARIFTVNVENNQGSLVNYDIFAKAGASHTAVVEQFNNISVTDGFMNISFLNVQDNGKLSGIEIISNDSVVNAAPVVANPVTDQIVLKNTPNKVISLLNTFSDDLGINNLTLTVSGNTNPALVTGAAISGTSLTLNFAANKTDTATVTVKATDASGLFVEDTFKVTMIEGSPEPTTIRINSGGPAYILDGLTWVADQYFTGGSVYGDAMPIAGTTNDSLHHDERYGTHSYAVPVTNGNYTVKLHFAEIFFTAPGARIFNVNVENGQGVLTNYDIFAKAGASHTAVVEQFMNVAVTDGLLNINLENVQDNAKISGLEIISQDSVTNAAPQVINPVADKSYNENTVSANIDLTNVFADDKGADLLVLSVDSVYNKALVTGSTINGKILTLTFAANMVDSSLITIKATDTAGLSVTDQFKVVLKEVPAAPVAIRINSGGPAYTSEGISWSADQYFTGGGTYGDASPIAGTTNDALHQDERYGAITYAVPVTNGTYTVKLHFAEIYFTTTGSRIFNVNVENGQGALTNYDIFAKAGAAYTAVVEQFSNIQVTDGILNISLVNVLDNAKISGFEILSSGNVVNQAPVIATPIADVQVNVNTPSSTVNLLNTFADDGGAANITRTVDTFTTASPVSSATISGTTLTLNYNAGQTGVTQVVIRATDAQGLYVTDTFNVNVVTPPPAAPVLANPIADKQVAIGTTSLAVNLSNVFTDEKGAGNITLSVSGNTNPSLVTGAGITGNTLTLTFASNLTGTALIKVKATDSDALFTEDEFQVEVMTSVPVPAIQKRINAGGQDLTFDGQLWMADNSYTGGNEYGDNPAIAGTTNDELYQTERWGDVTYKIPVPNGKYTVKLHFAEIYWTTPGKRVFNINVENGQGISNNYDIVAKAGAGFTAVVEQFTNINVTDDTVSISLVSLIDNAKISGIEIISDSMVYNNTRKISSFDAEVVNSSVELNWTPMAGTEAIYTIERSRDGVVFETLNTTIVSKNERKQIVRRFADIDPHSGISYYRLKSADRTKGTVQYSAVKTITISKNNHSFMVYPNPNTTGVLFMEFPKELGSQDNLRIRVLNIQGAVVYQQQQAERSGVMLKLNLPRSLNNGAYIVEIEKGGKRYHARFLINR